MQNWNQIFRDRFRHVVNDGGTIPCPLGYTESALKGTQGLANEFRRVRRLAGPRKVGMRFSVKDACGAICTDNLPLHLISIKFLAQSCNNDSIFRARLWAQIYVMTLPERFKGFPYS